MLPDPRRSPFALMLALYAAGCFLAYWLFLYRLDLVIVTVWFTTALLLEFTGKTARLTRRELLVQRAAVLLFPPWEFTLKWLIENGLGDAFWLNRLEHWGWMTASLLLLFPLYRRAWHALHVTRQFVLLLAFASLIGNVIEFYEFGVRVLRYDAPFGKAYRDTIIDMAVNLTGGVTAFLIWSLASRRGSR